ncbi:D-alanyl-glycyl endopeptidase-like protein [Leishmania donovani]|nr:D-alanyl-glycyl endopeptidase-like protein [Leishmania donovani]CBZ37439.1 D-alanyl-glycyl endopeptidase-like protein [Leishmania donovani]
MAAAPLSRTFSPKSSESSFSSHSQERMEQNYRESAAGFGPPPAESASNAANGDVVVCQSRSHRETTAQPNTSGNNYGESTRVGARDNKSADSGIASAGVARCFVLTHDPLLYGVLKWGLATLLLLFLAFVVFGMLYSSIRYGGNCTGTNGTSGGTVKPREPCVTPFSTILGVFNGVFGYSNCNDSYVSTELGYINLTVPELNNETGQVTYISKQFYTGLAWQCVEYARRYWMQSGTPQPAYFESVPGAADIWNLTFVRLLSNTSMKLPLHRFRNGDPVTSNLQVPAVGDIIIYPVQDGGFPYGHVAVIASVEISTHGAIYVAEQNWANAVWPSAYHNYSRRIPLYYDMLTSTITLDDPKGKIIGWVRYG